MNKIIGFAPIYNEIEIIEGWYENISQFCDEVWAIYDPRSDDGTTEYLKKLEGGYVPNQDYRSFINFTKFSDEEFFLLKDKFEKIIHKNFFIQSLKNPKFFVSFYAPRTKNLLKKTGFVGLLKKFLSEMGILHE